VEHSADEEIGRYPFAERVAVPQVIGSGGKAWRTAKLAHQLASGGAAASDATVLVLGRVLAPAGRHTAPHQTTTADTTIGIRYGNVLFSRSACATVVIQKASPRTGKGWATSRRKAKGLSESA
jgi:hypothetical protein